MLGYKIPAAIDPAIDCVTTDHSGHDTKADKVQNPNRNQCAGEILHDAEVA